MTQASPRPHADAAFVQTAIDVYETELARDRARFYETAARLRPEVPRDSSRLVELHHGGQSYAARVFRRGPREYRLEVDGQCLDARVERRGQFERRLGLGERSHRIVSVPQGSRHLVEVDGIPYRFSRADVGIVRADAPAVVVSLAVKPGDEVKAGDTLAVLEAMKMETAVRAPFAGRVRHLLVTANTQVAPGAPLLQLDAEAAEAGPARGRIVFSSSVDCCADTPSDQALANLEAIRRLVLGFDSDPAETRTLASEYTRLFREGQEDADRRRLEDEILGIFADLASLFRRQSAPDEDEELGPTSSGEYFLTYLRTLDAEAGPLPRRFLERLSRAVAHYGVFTLDRTPALEDALFWIYKAQRSLDAAAEMVSAILERRIETPEAHPDAGFAVLLDRLVRASEGRRPSLCDLAREARYRIFDQPLYDARRRHVYAEAEAQLQKLRETLAPGERESVIAALVGCPQPLQSLISSRLEGETPAMRGVLLEILVRRYYRIRPLEEVHAEEGATRALARAAYTLEDRRIRLLSTHARLAGLRETLESLRSELEAEAAHGDVVLDLYLWREGPLGSANESATEIRAVLEAALVDLSLHRVGITLAAPGNGQWQPRAPVLHVPSGPAGYVEDVLYRGVHPMMGKRLRLARLANFDSSGCRRRRTSTCSEAWPGTNPKDERLFAIAEVRDLTPVRDPAGRLVAAAVSGAHVHGGARRDPALPGRGAGPTRGCTGTASCSTCGRR